MTPPCQWGRRNRRIFREGRYSKKKDLPGLISGVPSNIEEGFDENGRILK